MYNNYGTGIVISYSYNNSIIENNITNKGKGIYIHTSKNNTIIKNNISNNGYGIYSFRSKINEIKYNFFYNNGNSIYFFGSSDNNKIENNTIFNSSWGIDLRESTNNSITNNNISKSTYSIWLEYSNDNHIKNNNIYNNHNGIQLKPSCNNNVIINNRIFFNNDKGINIYSCDNNSIIDNDIYSNKDGIKIYHSKNNTITNNNIFFNSNYGLFLHSSSEIKMRNNTLNNNKYSLGFQIEDINNFYHDIDATNSINGKPTIYYNKRNNLTIDEKIDPSFILLISCSNITIKNVSINNLSHGIIIINTSNSQIKYCELFHNDYAIYSYSSSFNQIKNNNITNNSDGIYFDTSCINNEIINNNIYDNNNIGIQLESSNNNNSIIKNNIYSNNKHGILLHQSCNGNLVVNNKIFINGEHGIFLESSCKFNHILNNNIYSNNDYGLFIFSNSNNNTIINNNISKNKYGIKIHNSKINPIKNSSIINNDYDFYLSKNSEITVINTTFNKNKVYIDDEKSKLTLNWYLSILVLDKWNNQIQEAIIKIQDNENGTFNQNYITNSKGYVKWISLTEYIENKNDAKIYYTPHSVIVEKDKLTNTTEITVDQNKEIIIILSNDWVVIENENHSNKTIILNGNLTIENGGNLTFHNVTLKMNCSKDGEYHIEVKNRGQFHIFDNDNNKITTEDASNITAVNPEYEFQFWVRKGSIFEMKNSELHECGYSDNSQSNQGLYIQTDNAIIENNTISNNYNGIILSGSNESKIFGNSIFTNAKVGIDLQSSNNNLIKNNMLYDNVDGIALIESNFNKIIFNEALNNDDDGIDIDPGCEQNHISNNIANNNDYGIILTQSIDNTILNNTAKSNTFNGISLYLDSHNNTILNNTASNNLAAGIAAYSSNNSQIINNLIESNFLTGIYLDLSHDFIINCTLSKNTFNDLYLDNGAVAEVLNCSFNKGKVHFEDDNSIIIVTWLLDVLVLDRFGSPANNAIVRIQDNENGEFDENYLTDQNGFIKWIECTEYSETSSSKTTFTPHNITASKYENSNETTVTIDQNKEEILKLKPIDWIVISEESYENETKILTGNLTIEKTGNLTFHNVTLIMNCSSPGEFSITVKNGGQFYIYDFDKSNKTTVDASNITSQNPDYNYNFSVEKGAKLTMKNSEIHECGMENSGLIIESDDVLIDNNLISNNIIGIFCNLSNPMISNNTIINNNGTGIKCENSNPTIIGNKIINNEKIGIYCRNSNPIIINNKISNQTHGIFNFLSSPTIINCTLNNPGNDFSLVENSHLTIINTTFNRTKVSFNPESKSQSLKIQHFLNLEVINQFKTPIVGANVRIQDDDNGTYDENFLTDLNGTYNWILLTEYNETIDGKKYFTQHTINVSFENSFTEFKININESKKIKIIIEEKVLEVTITSPIKGETVKNIVTITTDIKNEKNLEFIAFHINGIEVQNSTKTEFNWNTSDYENSEYTIIVYAKDEKYYVWDSIKVTVNNEKNQAPIITTVGILEADILEPYNVQIEVTDQDISDTHTWKLETNATWLNIDENGKIYGTPDQFTIGSYWVNITVNDNGIPALSDYKNFTLIVDDFPDIRTFVNETLGVTVTIMYKGFGIVEIESTEQQPNIFKTGKIGIKFVNITPEKTLDIIWVNISIKYNKSDIPKDNKTNPPLDESTLLIYYLDNNSWILAENNVLDIDEKLITSNISHLTIFGLIGDEIIQHIEHEIDITNIEFNSPVFEGENITINATIKNIGTISISTFSVSFYYGFKPIGTIVIENALHPDDEITVKIIWKAVFGNHTIKVYIKINDEILASRESDEKIEVINAPTEDREKDDDKDNLPFLVILLPLIFLIIIIVTLIKFKKSGKQGKNNELEVRIQM